MSGKDKMVDLTLKFLLSNLSEEESEAMMQDRGDPGDEMLEPPLIRMKAKSLYQWIHAILDYDNERLELWSRCLAELHRDVNPERDAIILNWRAHIEASSKNLSSRLVEEGLPLFNVGMVLEALHYVLDAQSVV